MPAVLTQFLQILVGGIQTVATNVGAGLQTLVNSIFLDTSGTDPVLSTFGGVIAIFGAIALAIGLCTLVVKWIMSIGARN